MAALLLAACGTGRTATPAPDPGPAVRALLDASAEAWNRDDLDGFLADYAADASFVTSDGLVHGREGIRRIYERGYWQDGPGPRDDLRFEGLDVRRTGPRSAVAFGRYVLYDPETGGTRATGIFSLTLRQTGSGWEIVHDHSSSG